MKRNPRRVFAALLVLSASLLFALAFQPAAPTKDVGLRLGFQKLTRAAKNKSGAQRETLVGPLISLNSGPAFGHPIIAGVGGTGFEESIRVDPTLNVNGEHTIY